MFQLCIEYLKENMSVITAAETMQAAVTFGQDDLRESALEYIEQNTQVSLDLAWLFLSGGQWRGKYLPKTEGAVTRPGAGGDVVGDVNL